MPEQIIQGRKYSEWSASGADPSSIWFGHSKYRTKDCDSCPLLQVFDGIEWCMFGVGKILLEREKPKSCSLKFNSRPETPK